MGSTKPISYQLSPDKVSEQLGVSRKSVYHWITHGIDVNGVLVRLTAIRVGGMYRVSQDALNDFLRKCNPEEYRRIALEQELERREAKKDRKRLEEMLK